MANTEAKQNYRMRVKAEMVEITGGSCQVCGYNKSHAALDFHHLDPTEKEFGLSSQKTGTMNRADRFQELKKCILLCSNCHREFHAGLIDTTNLKIIINQEAYDKHVNGIVTPRIKNCTKCNAEINGDGTTGLCMTCYRESTRVVNRPNREELKSLIRNTTFTELGIRYSVSDNAVKKWCKNYNLPSTKKEIKLFTDEQWELL